MQQNSMTFRYFSPAKDEEMLCEIFKKSCSEHAANFIGHEQFRTRNIMVCDFITHIIRLTAFYGLVSFFSNFDENSIFPCGGVGGMFKISLNFEK
jgi:hypothetical protein